MKPVMIVCGYQTEESAVHVIGLVAIREDGDTEDALKDRLRAEAGIPSDADITYLTINEIPLDFCLQALACYGFQLAAPHTPSQRVDA